MVLPENIVDAAESGDVTTVRAWLDADPAHDVNDTDREGSGLLTVAGSCVDVTRGAALIAFLLARGADVNQRRGVTRLTTLHLVCLGASPGAVDALLLHGADVNALLADVEKPPHSPLSVAAGSLDYRITENELAADTDMDRLRYKAESTHRTVVQKARASPCTGSFDRGQGQVACWMVNTDGSCCADKCVKSAACARARVHVTRQACRNPLTCR